MRGLGAPTADAPSHQWSGKPSMMISYAQNFEDVLLQRALGDIEQGFYVDLGANHPEVDSVTKWFYDRGWSGINVEPVPYLHQRLQDERPRDTNLAVAGGREEGRAVLHIFHESPGLSTLNATVAEHARRQADPVEVEVWPLVKIMALAGERPVHFLKIDVEGAEREVLEGMDFTRFRPWVLVIESAPPDGMGPTGAPWEDLVLPFGYRMAWFDGLNRFYVAEEHLDRLPRLAMPPHVFDAFELAATRQARLGREAAETALGEARQQEASLRSSQQQAAAELARLHSEIAFQRSVIALSEQHLAAARQEVEAARQEAVAARQDAATASQDARQARETASSFLHSTSWRVTAPLRAATRLLRRP
jgi:FkbM family methyltransferase